jgi:hypothetical protein
MLFLFLCVGSSALDKPVVLDDHTQVFKQITDTLDHIAAGLEGIQEAESAGRAREYLPVLLTRLDELEKKWVVLEEPPSEGATAASLGSLGVARSVLENRIRAELDRLKENPAFMETLGEVIDKLGEKFPDKNEFRDPFEPQGALLERTLGRNSGMGRFAGPRRNFMPLITLHGWVEDAKGDKVALLKVKDAGTFLVREKDKVTVTTEQSFSEIEIEKIGRSGVVLKTGMPPITQIIR